MRRRFFYFLLVLFSCVSMANATGVNVRINNADGSYLTGYQVGNSTATNIILAIYDRAGAASAANVQVDSYSAKGYFALALNVNQLSGSISGSSDSLVSLQRKNIASALAYLKTRQGLAVNIIGVGLTLSSTYTVTPLNTLQVTWYSINNAPVIRGAPSVVAREGQSYGFQPITEDLDRDVLSFSVKNLPAWLTLDRATGRISGVPRLQNVGAYYNIAISVSDGKRVVSLNSFTITVHETSAALSWTPPVARADGTPLPLSELRGYRIYAGIDPNKLVLLADINDAATTHYRITNLRPATYYYGVTSYNRFGVESEISPIINKKIN